MVLTFDILILALFAIVGTMAAFFGLSRVLRAISLSRNGTPAKAKCIRINTQEKMMRQNEGPMTELRYLSVVAFHLPNGEPIEAPLLSKKSREKCLSIGQTVNILYNPDRPTEVIVAGDKSPIIIGLLMTLGGTVFFAISLSLLRTQI